LNNKAVTYSQTGNFERSNHYLETALQQKGSNQNGITTFQLGKSLYNQGKYEQAVTYFDESIKA
jgi:tetratricopeptide (TPR) repeat protein